MWMWMWMWISSCSLNGQLVVRGSPLAVIMGLVDSRTAYTTPRPASVWPSGVPFSGGSYQSREELERRPVG